MGKCVLCGLEFNYGYTLLTGEEVCESCREIECGSCSKCGGLDIGSRIAEHYDWDADVYLNLCFDCYKKETKLYPHDYSPHLNFSNESDRSHVLHIGVELEILCDKKNKFLTKLNNFEKDFYPKYDGSLDDGGVEIVSHPMIMPTLLSKWKNIFDLFQDTYVTYDCGLHFHLDRKYLTERQIKNIDYIVNNVPDLIEEIGDRKIKHHEWAELVEKNYNEWGINTTDRYVAVNLTNKNTVELRCFNATNDFEKFKKIIVFVCSLVELAQKHTFYYFYNKDEIVLTNYINTFMKDFAKKYLIDLV